jgi:glycosyltransferase involved in cell wall biosynthesis
VPRQLRVLHLIDKDRLTTGSVVQMLAAAEGMAARGHRVWVGSRRGGDLETACSSAGLAFVELPFRSVADFESVSRLRRHLHNWEPEILHVHKGLAHTVGLVAAAGIGRLPVVVVNRGVTFPLDLFNKWKYRHPRVRAIVCVADAVREVIIRTAGLGPDRVHTVYGGTDPEIFDMERIGGEEVRRELDLTPQNLVICQVSLRDWKGWSELVAAFSKISALNPNSRLLFVGCESRSELSMIEGAAREVGIQDRIMTLPFRTDMPSVFAACDVVVDASWAGTGITGTIREAMAMQRAVVATDCGGNRELVIDGEVGLLVPPRDIDALAVALDRLLDDAELRRRLGTAARKRVVKHFTTTRRIEKLEAVYREILSQTFERYNV